tara:strand:+ start:69 stop:836 length:768 start_codon:yes stop_codon:yes gene_type:complete
MISFNQERKDELIANLEAHHKLDSFRQGLYFEEGKGCAVGCSLFDFGEAVDDHSAYERLFGIPEALAEIEDGIFEGLGVEDSKLWPIEFTKAVPINTDLSMVVPKFIIWMLGDIKKHASVKNRRVIQTAIDFYLRVVNGDYVEEIEWLTAEKSFVSSGYNAADVAARYALRAAADDAARYAADAVRYADAASRAARYVARAAEAASCVSYADAADAAAEVAAETSARYTSCSVSFARCVARKGQAQKLLEILSNA